MSEKVHTTDLSGTGEVQTKPPQPSRQAYLQQIQQRKQLVLSFPYLKKLLKLAIYSKCQVTFNNKNKNRMGQLFTRLLLFIFKRKETKKRRLRCFDCDACRRPNCGDCGPCLDMVRFGGKGRMKKACSVL